jgi:hypothetical protein
MIFALELSEAWFNLGTEIRWRISGNQKRAHNIDVLFGPGRGDFGLRHLRLEAHENGRCKQSSGFIHFITRLSWHASQAIVRSGQGLGLRPPGRPAGCAGNGSGL